MVQPLTDLSLRDFSLRDSTCRKCADPLMISNITYITLEDTRSIRDNGNLFLAAVSLEIQLNAADTLL